MCRMSNLCLQPEFGDSQQVDWLLAEKKDLLARLMSERRSVVVTIGADHPLIVCVSVGWLRPATM